MKKKEKVHYAIKTVDNSIKGIKTFFGAWITLPNNEIKDIIKAIKSLESRWILLKWTTKKVSQVWGFLNFLRPLMTVGLPLMKSVHTPLAESVLLPLGLSAGMSAANAPIQKKKKIMDQELQH